MTRIGDDSPASVGAVEADTARVGATSIDASGVFGFATVDAGSFELVTVDASTFVAVADAGMPLPADAGLDVVAVAAQPTPPTKPKPIKTTPVGGKTVKPAAGKPKFAGSADGALPTAPGKIVKRAKPPTKSKQPDEGKVAATPAVCVAARRCCLAVAGKTQNCNTHLKSDQATCETALAELRGLATNKKQMAVCR
jgi:hypothetical protein